MQITSKYNKKTYRWFASIIGISNDNTTRNLYLLFKIALFATISILILDLVVFLFERDASAGTFGDFFGGVLNPILTFLTFMGLLITIILQQKELRLAREENKRSADALERTLSEAKFQSEIMLNDTYKKDIYTFLEDIIKQITELKQTKIFQEKTIQENGKFKILKQEVFAFPIFHELAQKHWGANNDWTIRDLEKQTHFPASDFIYKLNQYYEMIDSLASLTTSGAVLRRYYDRYSFEVFNIRQVWDQYLKIHVELGEKLKNIKNTSQQNAAHGLPEQPGNQ